ncbi:hypothetical protein OESDEN_00187 [Oesophagostomum dentatum]|uniref:Uncharacterized protein n=1 Tax=Oesophagostomum dentatum TaxID=61180 RepID=A0A0B1TQL8_OESDE|nr:hypothetical protein OESDEN_00187 [Oesophagostomum dentatum]
MSSQVITTITAHLKLIVVGTQMGYIWIMDHFGHVDHQHVPVETSERLISLIPPSHDIDLARSSQYPPVHCWIDDTLLAIAWADTLTIVKPLRRAEIHFSWHLNMFCSGVSYVTRRSDACPDIIVFGLKYGSETETDETSSETAALECDSSSDLNEEEPVPFVQFCLFGPKTYSSYSLLAEDRLSLSANRSSQPCQFSMAGLPCFESYFLAGPTDLVMVTPYSAEDTVRWRVENGLLEEAWELACEKHAELESMRYDEFGVGVGYQHIRALSPLHTDRGVPFQFLPTSNPQLEPECYETVLQAALYNDVSLFKRLVQQWSPDLYRTGFVTGMTLKRIQEIVSSQTEANRSLQSDEIRLYHALAHLYLHERKFDSALKIYLSLKDPQIFAVIDKYQLFEQVKDQVSELMRINTDRALRLLLDNEDNVPASLVMEKIARQPKLQLAYLTKLLNKNEGAEFADQAVRLYAELDRKKLIPFLRKNENYHIRRALEICRQKNFVEEMILLFGKSGKHAEALDLVIKKYNQLDKAIEYCQEHDDTDLWARLIEEVIETPAHVAYLLNHAGSSIDPLHVIEKIPPVMPVPGLRDALAKVLRDYATKVSLQCGCQEATRGDVRELLTHHLQTEALPVYLTMETHCSMCGRKFICSDARGPELRMFGCGHIAHLSCCLEAERKLVLESGTCLACSDTTRDEVIS